MALRGGGDAAAPGPAQLFGALVDQLNGGGYVSLPAPHVFSLRVCRDEISTIRRRIATGAYLHARPDLSSARSTRRDHSGQARQRRHGSPCDARGVGRSRDGWRILCSAPGRYGNENPHGVVEAASGRDTKARHRATIGSQLLLDTTGGSRCPSMSSCARGATKSLEVVLTAACARRNDD
jgi:hypothetical protein